MAEINRRELLRAGVSLSVLARMAGAGGLFVGADREVDSHVKEPLTGPRVSLQPRCTANQLLRS